ncbi:uncharacterized protein [Periplaneta americana]|uniref:uncharacterized protein isoform X1 n=1 Tax=Periplaneta americana TaxID=6978 RepID=UPI0037E866BB
MIGKLRTPSNLCLARPVYSGPGSAAAIMMTMYSQRGNQLTLLDGYKYRRYYMNEQQQKWRCTVKICNAKIVTNATGNVLLTKEGSHNHERDETVHRQVVTNAAKRKAREEDLFDRPTKLIKKEICSAPKEIREKITTVDINLTRRNLYTQRRKLFPAPPKASQEVNEIIEILKTENSDGEDLLLVNDPRDELQASPADAMFSNSWPEQQIQVSAEEDEEPEAKKVRVSTPDVDVDTAPAGSRDPLDMFFCSMCESTKRLQVDLQLRVKRQLFEAVAQAEEEQQARTLLSRANSVPY